MSFMNQHVYDMSHASRGVCLIINNEHLAGAGKQKSRTGSALDAEAATAQFAALGFEIRRKNDLTVLEMLDCIEEVAGEDHSPRSCFVLVLLTEGRNADTVCGADFAEIPLEDLFEPFKGKNCPGLIGKPKIFIIEAGRGQAFDAGVEETDAQPFSSPLPSGKIPHEADVICAYSTVPDYVSWRSHSEGSWYIQTLCRVLAEHSDKPFLLVLDHVTQLVAHGKQSKSSKAAHTDKKQMPQIVSQLTKTLYLAPASKGFGDRF